MRVVLGLSRWVACVRVSRACGASARPGGHDRRRDRLGLFTASGPGGVRGGGRRAVRLLHSGPHRGHSRPAAQSPAADHGADPRGAGREHLPVHGLRQDHRRGPPRGGPDGGAEMIAKPRLVPAAVMSGRVGEAVTRPGAALKTPGGFPYSPELQVERMVWGAAARRPPPYARPPSTATDQAPLGPESGLAIPDGEGGVDLYIATQWLHVDRDQLAGCLGLPVEKIRLTMAGIGGAFGAREDLSMQAHACMLAMRTRRPVKMAYSRAESFVGHVHRHPARMRYEHGATRDGTLVYVKARILLDGGAYASSSTAVISNACCFAVGPYECPSATIDGWVVYTNNPPCGAMRGFGSVQNCYAHEAQMDKLAAALEMDPVELRMRNALETGDRVITGQTIDGAVPVAELLRRVHAMPLPDDSRPLPIHGEGKGGADPT